MTRLQRVSPQGRGAAGVGAMTPPSPTAARATGGRGATVAAPAVLPVAAAAYWQGAPKLAIVLIAIIAVRVHELLPFVYHLHPALVAAVVGLALLLAKSKSDVFHSAFEDPAMRISLGYFAWAAVTVPFAMWVGGAISAMQPLFSAVLLLVVILTCAPTPTNVQKLTSGFVGAVAVFAAILIAMGTQNVEGRLEASGMFDTNDMSALMAMCFPLAAAGVIHRRGVMRLLYGATAVLCLLAILKSGSRGGVIALVVGAMVLVAGLRGSRRFLVFAAFIAAGFGGWQIAPPTFRERMMSMTSIGQDYNETEYTGRKQIWKRGRMYYRQHPIVGVGIGNFPVAEGRLLESVGQRGKWSAAHNAYVQAFAELGTIGGCLFVALLLVSVRRAFTLWRARDETYAPGYLASLLAFCSSAYFLSHAYFYALFGLVGIIGLAVRAAQGVTLAPAFATAPMAAGGGGGRVSRFARGIGWRSAAGAQRQRSQRAPAPRPADGRRSV